MFLCPTSLCCDRNQLDVATQWNIMRPPLCKRFVSGQRNSQITRPGWPCKYITGILNLRIKDDRIMHFNRELCITDLHWPFISCEFRWFPLSALISCSLKQTLQTMTMLSLSLSISPAIFGWCLLWWLALTHQPVCHNLWSYTSDRHLPRHPDS